MSGIRHYIQIVETEAKAPATEYIAAAHAALDAAGIPKNVAVMLDTNTTGFYSEHPIVHIDYIEVPRRRRGQGLGTRVMEILTQLADERGIALCAREGSVAGANLAYRFGFEGEGRMIRNPVGVITEGRDAPLYHFTVFPSFANMCRYDQLGLFSHSGGGVAISLTRDPRLPLSDGLDIVLVLDQAALATRYRMAPLYGDSRTKWAHDPKDESEERVTNAPIKPLHRYLKAVYAPERDIRAMQDAYADGLHKLERIAYSGDYRDRAAVIAAYLVKHDIPLYPRDDADPQWHRRATTRVVFDSSGRVDESFDDDYDKDDPSHQAAAVQRTITAVTAFAKRVGVRAVFQPFGHPSEFEMTDLYAAKPGHGAGTKVMTLLGQMCDRYGLNVYCKPESPRNVEFYARFGFERSKQHFGLLVRFPPLDLDEAVDYEAFTRTGRVSR